MVSSLINEYPEQRPPPRHKYCGDGGIVYGPKVCHETSLSMATSKTQTGEHDGHHKHVLSITGTQANEQNGLALVRKQYTYS